MVTNVEIKDSARKYGIQEADILHAGANAVFVHYFDDYQMIVGAARDARMLEIAINLSGEVFHAMPARSKSLRRR